MTYVLLPPGVYKVRKCGGDDPYAVEITTGQFEGRRLLLPAYLKMPEEGDALIRVDISHSDKPEPKSTEPITPFMLQVKPGSLVQFTYTNHRGETRHRYVLVIKFEYGQNEYYRTPQFLMRAFDIEKQVERSFAVSKIAADLEVIY